MRASRRRIQRCIVLHLIFRFTKLLRRYFCDIVSRNIQLLAIDLQRAENRRLLHDLAPELRQSLLHHVLCNVLVPFARDDLALRVVGVRSFAEQNGTFVALGAAQELRQRLGARANAEDEDACRERVECATVAHFHLRRLSSPSRALLLLIVVLALHALSLFREPWPEEIGWVEVFLYVADDLGGAHAGGLGDCWIERWVVSCGGRGLCREWNPTIPKQPSGILEAMVDVVEDCDAWKMLRQMSCRPPME